MLRKKLNGAIEIEKKKMNCKKEEGQGKEQSSANTHSVQYFIVENVKRKK
jgi:hypothetical protein